MRKATTPLTRAGVKEVALVVFKLDRVCGTQTSPASDRVGLARRAADQYPLFGSAKRIAYPAINHLVRRDTKLSTPGLRRGDASFLRD